MDSEFLRGFGLGLFLLVGYRAVMVYRDEIFFLKTQIRELQTRVENLEEFKFRFYQIYSIKDTRVWNQNDDETTDEEFLLGDDEDDEDEDDDEDDF